MKAAFFDIDNTLIDWQGKLCDSAGEAIRLLKKAGYLTFLNSGRTRAYIQNPALLAPGFDGIISGCGTLLEFHGRTLYYHTVEPAFGKFWLATLQKHGFKTILEGRYHLYFDSDEFTDDAYIARLTKEVGDLHLPIAGSPNPEFSKTSCSTIDADRTGCFYALAPWCDYFIHSDEVVEIAEKGFSKGSGMRLLCAMLSIDLKNTVAFGDGINDIDMLRTAGRAIVMGNGAKEAQDAADYVTGSIHEDGIYTACEKLHLFG